MQSLKIYYQKTLSFLRIRSHADGLEVSDQVLRLVYLHDEEWRMAAVRLTPGILEKGIIKDKEAFANALRELRAQVPEMKRKDKKMNLFVALSSVNIYSQVFTLPFMEGEDLDKAIALNVQMVSPVDIANSYFGWQLLGRDEASLRSEIAAAFVEKAVVDDMIHALYAAGFITVGIVSRALAFVQTLREKGVGVDKEKSYLLVDIDNSGIDFLIIRKGKLYFEYANAWADIADEKGQIPVTKFEETLTVNLRQVLNFFSQHWPEPLAGIILSAVAFEEQAEQAVKNSTTLPLVQISLATSQQISPEWFVAFGCGLRGLRIGSEDEEINLSGSGAMDTFRREQTLNFFALWRVLIPVALGCLVLVYVLANNFLDATRASIESSLALSQPGSESANIASLEASSTAFNQSVALVANAETQINRDYLMIADINAIAAANGVTVTHISFRAANAPILVACTAQSETQIAAFQSAVQKDPHFGVVTLPLLNIQGNNGAYTFSVTFPLSSSGF